MGSPDDFLTGTAIMRFNGFRMVSADNAIALFDKVSMFSHSCCPNAEFDFEGPTCIAVRAIKDLAMGEEVCISYLPTFALRQSTEMRRLKLEDHLFTCQCARCQWPADLSRGLRCAVATCPGICFLPGATTTESAPCSTLPCTVCGKLLASTDL